MPYKFRERRVKAVTRKSYLPWIAAVVLILAIGSTLPYVWTRYRARSERLRLVQAQQALGRGDLKGALFDARAILQRSPWNYLAQEVVDRATEALKAPDTMSWLRAARAIETGDDDQLLGIAEAFIEARDYVTADRALEKVSAERQNAAIYHDLRAQIAAARNDFVGARRRWEEAARLAPQDERYRIQVVALRLNPANPAERTEALAELDRLKQTPGGALPARRALIADARRLGDLARTRELAAELSAIDGAQFADRLVLLDVLHLLRPKREVEFQATLTELKSRASANPLDVATLAGWLVENGLAFHVREWAVDLPAVYFSQPPAAPMLAQASMQTAEWKGLEELVAGAHWGELEFLRLAFFSLALERQDSRNASDTVWEDALKAAEVAPGRLERLARACENWGWRDRVQEVLWKLAPSDWCPRWAMEYLWATAQWRRDTARMSQVAKLQLRMDPRDLTLRNNHAALALLLGEADEATRREAQAVHEESPASTPIAATYALSLFLQKRVHEAVAVLESYPAGDLRQPAVALYFGAFLAAAGQTERAAEYLRLAESARKLPEEAALVRVFTAVCEGRAREETGAHDAAQARWSDALRAADRQPVWLEILATTAIEWNWTAAADAALLKLATEDRCPPGAEERLWAAALKTGNETQLYRASRLLARIRPDDATTRSRYVLLTVLGQRTKEPPLSLAEQLVKQFPASADAAAALALALVQQGKSERAVEVLGAHPRQEPRAALYSGIVLAAAGRIDEAEPLLKIGAPSARYSEERALVTMMQAAFAAMRAEQRGSPRESDDHWARALEAARDRTDWVEMLARMAAAGAPRHAQAAMWKLAASENCPPWVVQALWAAASVKGTSSERYRASRLMAKSDPKDLAARCTWIVLALLTNQELDAPDREAKAVHSTHVTESAAAIAYALSLFLHEQRGEAIKVLTALPAAQLALPRTAFYLGVFLAAEGNTEPAATQLRAASRAQIFPEERAFAERAVTAEALRAIVWSWPVSTP